MAASITARPLDILARCRWSLALFPIADRADRDVRTARSRREKMEVDATLFIVLFVLAALHAGGCSKDAQHE
jgi:hypothetical protein